MYKTMYIDRDKKAIRDYANGLWLNAKNKVDDLLCDYNCSPSDFGYDYELFLRIGRIIDRFENTLFNNQYSLGCIIEVCKKNLQGVQNSQAYFNLEEIIEVLNKLSKKLMHISNQVDYETYIKNMLDLTLVNKVTTTQK